MKDTTRRGRNASDFPARNPAGGLGSAVADALLEAGVQGLRFTHLCVRDLPGSGSSQELLAAAGIDAGHIEAAARDLPAG